MLWSMFASAPRDSPPRQQVEMEGDSGLPSSSRIRAFLASDESLYRVRQPAQFLAQVAHLRPL